MKKSLFIITLIAALFLSAGCATTENILTLPNPDGNTLFVHPVSITSKTEAVQKVNIDITVYVSQDNLIDNPVLNFTITSTNLDKLQNIKLQLKNSTKTVKCENITRLYKQLGSSKNSYDYRYTSQINKDDFMTFLKDSSPVSIILEYEDGTKSTYQSKEFETKLSELRMLLS